MYYVYEKVNLNKSNIIYKKRDYFHIKYSYLISLVYTQRPCRYCCCMYKMFVYLISSTAAMTTTKKFQRKLSIYQKFYLISDLMLS